MVIFPKTSWDAPKSGDVVEIRTLMGIWVSLKLGYYPQI
jgi:hypothetical protein